MLTKILFSSEFSSAVVIEKTPPQPEGDYLLTWMYPPSMNLGASEKSLESRMFAADTIIKPSYEVNVAAQGSVAMTLTPSVAFKVQVDINGLLETDTHIRGAFANRMVLGVATDKSCDGLEYWVDYDQSFKVITNAPALGWDTDVRNIYKYSARLLPKKCYAFEKQNSSDTEPGGLIRARDDDDDDDEPAVNPLFPDPRGFAIVCARDTFVPTGPCGNIFDEDGNEIDPECVGSDDNSGGSSSQPGARAIPSISGRENTATELRPEYVAHQRWFEARALIEKRSTKSSFTICDSKRSVNPRINIAKLDFPSSGEMIKAIKEDGDFFATYGPEDKDDMLNYGKNSCSSFNLHKRGCNILTRRQISAYKIPQTQAIPPCIIPNTYW